jgi:hypothetical protein
MAYSKYKAVATHVDGIRFPSMAEARRYSELQALERAGIIKKLELQPRFDICINGKLCFFYKADFAYEENGAQITEDVKGMKTDVYALKKKCVEAAYNIKITEIGIRPKRDARSERIAQEVKEIFQQAKRGNK